MTTNRPYREKLEELIRIGEQLLTADLDPRLLNEVKEHVDSLRVKLYKAKVEDVI